MRAAGWVAAGAVVIGLGIWAGVRVQRRPSRAVGTPAIVAPPPAPSPRLQAVRWSEPAAEREPTDEPAPSPAAVDGGARAEAQADFERALAELGGLAERRASRAAVRKASHRASQAFEVYSTTVDGTTAAGRDRLDAAYAELMAGLRAVDGKAGKRRR